MPVLVTAAHRPLARRIALRLLEEGGEVRVHTDGNPSAVQAAGAFVARGRPDDEGHLEAALADVHTLVHVGSGLLTPDPEEDDRRVTEAVVAAAANAAVARIVALSLPGAAPDGPDPLRRAKGSMEVLLRACPVPSVVLRVSLVDTPTVRDAIITSGTERAVLDTRVAPVRAVDVAELVVAFDRARSRSSSGHLVVAADGPERMPMREYLWSSGVATASGSGSATPTRTGRRLVGAGSAATLRSALPGPWWSDDPALVDGWRFAGLTPRPPGEGGS